MPLLSTSGADCIQGYGFGTGQAGVLTTYTFPFGTSTWTAPAGTINIITAVGRGSNGQAAQWTDFIAYHYLANVFTGGYDPGYSTVNPNTTVGDVYTEATAIFNARVAAITATAPPGTYISSYYGVDYFTNVPTAGQLEKGTTNYSAGYYYKSSPAINYGGFTSGSTVTLNSLSSNPGAAASTGIYYLDPGYTGNSTTGFGLTFPGGTPSSPSAPTTTFNNTTVIPGVTYNITNNGSLTITYLA